MARHPGRKIALIIVILALIVGVFFAADAVVKNRSEASTSAQLTEQLSADQAVETHFDDWPFLFSVARNRLESGEFSLQDATLQFADQPVHVRSAQVNLAGLEPMRDSAHATAETLDGSVVIAWDTLSEITGIELASAGDGRVKAGATITSFWTDMDIEVTAELELVDSTGQLNLIDPEANIAGVEVPDRILQGAVDSLHDRLVLPALPAGLEYTGVSVSDDGAGATVHGSDVQIEELS